MGHDPKMRWSMRVAVVVAVMTSFVGAVVNNGAANAADKEGPPGLIEIHNADDLIAEASVETQKREIPSGGLSNSYGEPIPADSYGPPPIDDGKHSAQLIASLGVSDSYGPPGKPDLGLPIPVYGVPDDPSNHVKYPEPPPDIPPPVGHIRPHETYGPPKVNFAHVHHSGRPEIIDAHKITVSGGGSHQYHGPPPPLHPQYGPPPKIQYHPPKPVYGPPKPQFNHPPKPHYGPPPKITLGVPKPAFGPPPKPQYGPPLKPQYGPPKLSLGIPKPAFGPLPKPQYGPPPPPPKLQYGPPKFQSLPRPEYGPPKIQFASKPVFLQKPHPIYGPPVSHVETHVLKPSFPIPEDTYGPPGKPLGEHFSQHLSSSEHILGPPIGIHHGPPQPDPDPKPAHPGIPAPPTPPHILYDGWTPIPGLISKPPSNHGIGPPPAPVSEGSFISTFHSGGSSGGVFGVPAATYGVPAQSLDVKLIGGGGGHSSNSFITDGYSSVSGNEGLQGIDLNSIIGSTHGGDGEGIGLQGSKTVFEAHYTEGGHQSHGDSFSVVQGIGFDISGSGSHGSRQLGHSDFDLTPPSGKYDVPPPPPPPSHLSISYGVPSGSVGTGNINPLGVSPPQTPISFRDPVPQGLIENIGHAVVQKDAFGFDHSGGHQAYLSPPVQELPAKEPVQFISSSGSDSAFSIQASIEPSNLYSLPHAGNPINFQSSSDNHIIDTYGAPSIQNSVTTTLDGKTIDSQNNDEDEENVTVGTDAASLAAAILKNCPYHKALYEAAKNVEQNAAADSNSASESSNSFKVLPPNLNAIIESTEKSKDAADKGKALNLIDNQSASVIFQALQGQNDQSHIEHQQILGQNYEVLSGVHNIPVQGNLGTYTLQIQSADGLGGQQQQSDSIPHEQVLSEGLLQSILQAIEQPHQTQIIPQVQPVVVQQQLPYQQGGYIDLSQAPSGLVLPEGYEIQPKAFTVQQKSSSSRGDQDPEDAEPAASDNDQVIIVSPQNSHKVTSKSFLEQFGFISKRVEKEKEPEIVTPLSIIDDNEIAVYFNKQEDDGLDYDSDKENKANTHDEELEEDEEDETTEMVTEISVETSISASEQKQEEDEDQDDGKEENLRNAQQYGGDVTKKGKFGDKLVKKAESKLDESSS